MACQCFRNIYVGIGRDLALRIHSDLPKTGTKSETGCFLSASFAQITVCGIFLDLLWLKAWCGEKRLLLVTRWRNAFLGRSVRSRAVQYFCHHNRIPGNQLLNNPANWNSTNGHE